MVPTNLRAFLDILRRENELIEISAPVDPNLELAEIHRRVIDARMKPGYPDELFPREDIVELVDRRWKEYFA